MKPSNRKGMKLLRSLSKLFESAGEPCGYVAAMRKIALAPVVVAPRPLTNKE